MGQTNNNYRNKTLKKTAQNWSKDFDIRVANFDGQFTEQEFKNKPLDLEEFLNRISNCVLIPSDNKNRRDAFQLKRKLLKNLQ